MPTNVLRPVAPTAVSAGPAGLRTTTLPTPGSPALPQVHPGPTESEAVMESLMPYFGEDRNMTRYLSYRATGFTVRESLQLIGVSERSLRTWRRDEEFLDWENNITSQRQRFGAQFAFAEFLRNFRLVMDKDYAVLSKALTQERLTPEEDRYLRTIRAQYTPQQLQTIQDVLLGKSSPGGGNFNFTQLVLQLSRV